jgi:hypothetical protein
LTYLELLRIVLASPIIGPNKRFRLPRFERGFERRYKRSALLARQRVKLVFHVLPPLDEHAELTTQQLERSVHCRRVSLSVSACIWDVVERHLGVPHHPRDDPGLVELRDLCRGFVQFAYS